MRAQTRLQACTLASHRARDAATSRLVIGGDEVASGGRSANTPLTLPKGSDPEALFRDYGPWLLRTLQHKFGKEVADDLLQETYRPDPAPAHLGLDLGPGENRRPRARAATHA